MTLIAIKQPRIVPKKVQKSERFVITPEVLALCSPESVEKTVKCMKQLEIYRCPYLHFTIEISEAAYNAESVWSGRGPLLPDGFYDFLAITTNFTFEECTSATQLLRNGTTKAVKNWKEWGDRWKDILIVLLATRNVVKDKVYNKLAKLGIGKDRNFEYTTTLRLPKTAIPNVTIGQSTGRVMPMHLRSGHARWQWAPKTGNFVYVGPGADDYVRRVPGTHTPIFIEPAFVNYDDEFVSKRTEYRLTGV